jgi:hypothetical protein
MENYWSLWKDGKKIGKITQQFGVLNPIYLPYGFSRHNGVDISAVEGTPICGIAGIVDVIGNDVKGYGLYVSIKDEVQQCWWTYAHMSKILVKHGQHIFTGDVIGKVGNTGNSTAAHLHVECKPFDYKAHLGDTLGRVPFDWFIEIMGDTMTDDQCQRIVDALKANTLVTLAASGVKATKDKGIETCYFEKAGYRVTIPGGDVYLASGLEWKDIIEK